MVLGPPCVLSFCPVSIIVNVDFVSGFPFVDDADLSSRSKCKDKQIVMKIFFTKGSMTS